MGKIIALTNECIPVYPRLYIHIFMRKISLYSPLIILGY